MSVQTSCTRSTASRPGRARPVVEDHRADGPCLCRGRRSASALERADGVGVRHQQHALRLPVHAAPAPTHWLRTRMCGVIFSTVRCGLGHRRARSRPVRRLFHVRHRRADLCRLPDLRGKSGISEHSNVTAKGPPIYPIHESCLRRSDDHDPGPCGNHALPRLPPDRPWPSRLKDVAEIDVVEEQLAHSEYAQRGLAQDRDRTNQDIEEAARQCGGGVAGHERSGTRSPDARLIVVVIMMGFPRRLR